MYTQHVHNKYDVFYGYGNVMQKMLIIIDKLNYVHITNLLIPDPHQQT